MKLKKIAKNCLLALLILAVASCSDLEEDPVGLLSPEVFFSTKADVEASMMGAYGLMASEQYYGVSFN